ncbi:SDR family oxidoreductase [Aliiroseovarius sp. Z3]|uniref:SDR family oxidoreductase n=1 Tax=Aliiroseovarius sp. Z3 TaxID=2811402 RepID=UPI0023B24CCF|nr:SDR family oxidoreductase [Aliiroseovarius sp. Z3]MDE9451688.1 SDR family oxidoreductase [Aliiroseovarius sp. Z3]
MNDLTGKKAIVIGGTSGIGAAVAEALAARGAEVVRASRSTGLDASEGAALTSWIAEQGPIDHLVFTAGSQAPGGAVAALEASAKVIAKELAPIRVNVVSPGLTETEAYAGLDTDERKTMLDGAASRLPAGRVAQPQDVAAGYLFVIETPSVTGAVIDIDGGALIN